MGSDDGEPEDKKPEPEDKKPEGKKSEPKARSPLFRIGKLLLLAAGVAAVLYFAGRAPKEQHVRIVLGEVALDVTGLDLEYASASSGGDVMRTTQLHFAPGAAPRVVSHDPSLPDGDYRLRIEVETRESRRTVETQVTLGGGSTQVNVSRALASP